jgi:dTDP-4-dehydrorhamnose 3,5-epimerase-like enzyme
VNSNTKIIDGSVFADDRGKLRFINDFNFSDVKRFYQVENHRQGFIRAWHAHRNEGKYVYVASGSALVGVASLGNLNTEARKFTLTSEKPQVLWIPPNHANGFMNLEDNTIVIFFSTSTLEDSKGDDIRFPWDKWNIWREEYR